MCSDVSVKPWITTDVSGKECLTVILALLLSSVYVKQFLVLQPQFLSWQSEPFAVQVALFLLLMTIQPSEDQALDQCFFNKW